MRWKDKFPYLGVSIPLSIMFYLIFWYSLKVEPDFVPPTSWWWDALYRALLWGIMLGVATSYGIYTIQRSKGLQTLFLIWCILAIPAILCSRLGIVKVAVEPIMINENPWVDAILIPVIISWAGFAVVSMLGFFSESAKD